VGRRLPFIIIGVLFWCATMISRSFYSVVFYEYDAWFWIVLVEYVIITSIGKIFFIMANTSYAALVPIAYPSEQYGSVSGIASAFEIVGVMLFALGFSYFYHFISLFWLTILASSLTVVSFLPLLVFWREDASQHKTKSDNETSDNDNVTSNSINTSDETSSLLNNGNEKTTSTTSIAAIPINNETVTETSSATSSSSAGCCSALSAFTHRNFVLVFCSTFVSYFGLAASNGYFVYFIREFIHPNYHWFSFIVKDPEQALGIYQFLSSLVGIIFSTAFGFIADCCTSPAMITWTRKILMLVGGLFSCASTAIIFTTLRFDFIMLAAVFGGIATGAIIPSNMALASQVLPNIKSSGKDLALWSTYKLVVEVFRSKKILTFSC